MLRTIDRRIEHWPLKAPFRISRGERLQTTIVSVAVHEGVYVGRGEGVPSARYNESAVSVAAQIASVSSAIADGITRNELRSILPAGSARCALDCALWDLEVALGFAFLKRPRPLTTALTVSLNTPERMAIAARALGKVAVVKVKVDGDQPEACLRAVRAELPDATLIVDANEAWTMAQVEGLQSVLAELRVAMLEQPLPAGADVLLEGFDRLVPICADESCHISADIDGLSSRYDLINIKLDKAGGLTEALEMLSKAKDLGLGVMAGCMVGTSLSIAPAFQIAAEATYADLDGPWLMSADRPKGVHFGHDGTIFPASVGFWGSSDRHSLLIDTCVGPA